MRVLLIECWHEFYGLQVREMSTGYALIIEKEGSLAEVLAGALEEAGFYSEVVTTGHEAQVRLAFTNPDLVLIDLNLPLLPGAVILRQVRAQKRLAKTRVILVTEDAKTAQSLGDDVDGVFLKPVDPAAFRALAVELCEAGTKLL